MDIFVLKVSDADNVDEALLMKFQKKEISNHARLKTHCFSYLMLDRILKEVYKVENREIIFVNEKPVLKSAEKGKYFSIGHSGEYIALGFSDSNCGVDIEKVKERDFKAIAERMGFKSQTLEEFYEDWTRYEAEYKLGTSKNAAKTWELDGYYLSAVSENSKEDYELYFQVFD